jgi:maltose O-acetyltransferase
MSFSTLIRRFNLGWVNAILPGRAFRFKRFLLNLIPGVSIGKRSRIVGKLTLSSCNVSIGEDCFINRDVAFYGNGRVILENDVTLAPSVRFYTGGHQVGPSENRAGPGFTDFIKVEKGSWVCAGASVVTKVGGITIAKGDVIASGALVLQDTEADCLYCGIPAEKKKKYGQ